MSTPFPTWLAGMRITAGGLGARDWKAVVQGSDQTLTNTTTMTNTNLAFTGVAGAVYYYNLLIAYGATVSADMQWDWVIPGDATIVRFTQALQTGDNVAGSATTAKTVVMRRPAGTTGVAAGGNEGDNLAPTQFQSAYDSGILTFGASGNAQIRFAPNTATSGSAATFRATSYLLYARVA